MQCQRTSTVVWTIESGANSLLATVVLQRVMGSPAAISPGVNSAISRAAINTSGSEATTSARPLSILGDTLVLPAIFALTTCSSCSLTSSESRLRHRSTR